ncbi:hypothetical protein EV356DRAFT_533926 [Viridothelium virens]|uniref:Protein kinase domain-containing protein n=1 Tax=Viridothelium virens TaxID=1048519 RepID=A0A6A6H5B3_VIRVR|nr:hypothetical protein EV356DRAFT_533926 [Viridothelium virens]
MDPVTAAGIGLSVTSLALQVFSGCITGYQMFIEAKDMPATYEHLRTRLRIEQTRCLNWGEKVGLLEELLDEPSQFLQLNHNLILNILLEVQKAFRSCMVVTKKYDPVAAASSRSSAIAISESHGSTFLERTLAAWRKGGRVASRIEWSVIKKDSFEELIKKLIHFNDRIESFLDRRTLDDLRQAQAQSNLMLLQVTEQVSQLRDLIAAVRLEQTAGPDMSPSFSRASTFVDRDDQMRSLASLAAFKAHALELEKATMEAPNLEIQMSDLVSLDQLRATRPVTKLKGRSVWIEWRETIADIDAMPKYKRQLADRVRALATILASPSKSPTFRSPDCLGYFLDETSRPQRYALVYSWPLGDSDLGAGIASLRDALASSTRISLNSRISLACRLSESLLHLHAVNWLHKGFRSDCVLFTAAGDRDFILSDVLISGFEFSRPALPDAMTVTHVFPVEQDLYRHPDLLDPEPARSKKSYDIYSLGLVLAEIAMWQPIEEITGIEVRRSRLYQVRERMLDEKTGIFDSIAERVGDIYAKVVRRCISGGESLGVDIGADEEDPKVGAEMQKIFHAEIVSKLRALKF